MRRKKDSKEEFAGKKEIEAKRKEAAIKKKKLDKIKKKQEKENRKQEKKNEKLRKDRRKKEKLKEKQIREIKRKKADPDRPLRMKKIKRIMKWCLLAVALLIAFGMFLMTPIFTIKNIEIDGCNQVSEQEVRNLLSIEENANLYRTTNIRIRSALKENRYIDSVIIRRVIPSTLKITIKEREVTYLYKIETGYACIDRNGNIIDTVVEPIEGKLKVYGFKTAAEDIIPGKKVCDEDIESFEVISVIEKTTENNEIRGIFTAIDISNKEDYVMYLESEGKRVHLGNATNMDIKMPYVKKILAKEAGHSGEIFVDMDLNKKNPYFREDV